MFKKSFMLVALIISVVFISAFTTQMVLTSDLPSAYDPNVSIDHAMKNSKTPLLIEFYADTCATCRRITPMVHDLLEEQGYDDKLTLVMLDLSEPDNQQIAQLFGVTELPGMYIFDAKKMKKHQIDSKNFLTRTTLKAAWDQVLSGKSPTKG